MKIADDRKIKGKRDRVVDTRNCGNDRRGTVRIKCGDNNGNAVNGLRVGDWLQAEVADI
ncbi:MAG: hypothetical protein V2G42_08240 [bacterium JZ-2024 1]